MNVLPSTPSGATVKVKELDGFSAAAFVVVNSGVNLVTFSRVLASFSGVIISDVGSMCPAVVVVGKFVRETQISG